jgi:flagellar motility protein MotE (MotC chaperone)
MSNFRPQLRSRVARIIAATVVISTMGALIAFLAESALRISSQAFATESSPSDQVAQPAASFDKGGACLADPAAVEDIKKRREELDARQKDIASRDTELKAREKALDDELKKMENIRDEIVKIVETFETMSSKAAARVLSELDETLAVASMARMDTQRLAKVMNVMDPAKSSRLTEILAGVVRAKNIVPVNNRTMAAAYSAAATTTQSVKGGETNDGHNKQSISGTTEGPDRESGSGQEKAN